MIKLIKKNIKSLFTVNTGYMNFFFFFACVLDDQQFIRFKFHIVFIYNFEKKKEKIEKNH